MDRSEVSLIAGWEREAENARYIIPWGEERHGAGLDDPDLEHLIVDDGGLAVGFVLLAGMKDENRSIELRRIVIAEKGRGYGRAAVEEVKRRCFEQLNGHRLWLDVVETNQRARGLYESAGFRVEGLLRECLKSREGFVSLVVMSMLSSEYVPSESIGRDDPPQRP